MGSATNLLRTGVLVLGLMALTAPSLAQTSGDANAPTGTEVEKNLPPKGNIGASEKSTPPDSMSRETETTGASPRGAMRPNPDALSPNPNAPAESERNVPPKGNIE